MKTNKLCKIASSRYFGSSDQIPSESGQRASRIIDLLEKLKFGESKDIHKKKRYNNNI